MWKAWLTPPPHDALSLVEVGLLAYATLWALDRLAATAPVSLTAPLFQFQVVFTVVISVRSGLGVRGESALAGLRRIALAGTIV